jgi:murein DD-endopeptidase MepM/ murein hydrolase activator NlpD
MTLPRTVYQLYLFLLCCLPPTAVWAQTGPKVCLPLKKLVVTSGYGYRKHPFTGKWTFHKGVDLKARHDTVFCSLEGRVREAGYHSQLGYHVRTEHDNVECVYAHLSAISVRKGQTVTSGHPLGITGSSGRATGKHLHFAVEYRGKPIHPLRFLRALVDTDTPNPRAQRVSVKK